MRKSISGKIGHRAAGFFDHIVGGGGSGRHHVARQIGDGKQDVGRLFFGGSEFVGYSLLLSLHLCHCSFSLLGFVALALFHEAANGVGLLLELGGEIVVLELKLTALSVELNYAGNGILAVETLHGEAFNHALGIFFYLL